MGEMIETGGMVVAAEVYPLLQRAGLDSFDAVMEFAGGTRICHKRGRSVYRFEIDGRAFYLKRNSLHRVEFWKAISRFRWPSLGAGTEWKNILAVQQAGIQTVTPVAMGERRRCGLETASFTLTEELYGAEPLEVVLLREFAGVLSVGRLREKRRLIRDLAAVARRFHGSGMNHQDFYLNHFFRNEAGGLYLLDLQRVGRRTMIPLRYQVKDLGQLHYSADFHEIGTRTDRLRFFLAYLERSALGPEDKKLARRVVAKVRRIALHDAKLLVRRRKRGELPPTGNGTISK